MYSKTKKQIGRMSELLAQGYSNADIARTINKEFKENLTPQMVQNTIKRQAIFRKQIVKTDKEFREIYKQTLFEFVEKVNENTKILENTRDILLKRLDELKKDIPESKLMNFIKEINASIRTQNDSIRTMNDLLKRMEVETQEVKISQVQAVQETLKMLKNLEEMGYLKIHPSYYKSEIFKETQKKNDT